MHTNEFVNIIVCVCVCVFLHFLRQNVEQSLRNLNTLARRPRASHSRLAQIERNFSALESDVAAVVGNKLSSYSSSAFLPVCVCVCFSCTYRLLWFAVTSVQVTVSVLLLLL